MTSLTFGKPDLIIFGIIFLSILIGVVRGLIKEFISLVAWVTAIVLAVLYASPLSQHFTFTKYEFIRTLTAFLLIFIGIVFIGALVNFVIGSLVRKTPFSIPDRILGSLFGFLRGIVFVTILILLCGLTPLPQSVWWQQSFFVMKFQELAIWLKERLPEEHAKVFHFSGDEESQTGTEKKQLDPGKENGKLKRQLEKITK